MDLMLPKEFSFKLPSLNAIEQNEKMPSIVQCIQQQQQPCGNEPVHSWIERDDTLKITFGTATFFIAPNVQRIMLLDYLNMNHDCGNALPTNEVS